METKPNKTSRNIGMLPVGIVCVAMAPVFLFISPGEPLMYIPATLLFLGGLYFFYQVGKGSAGK